MDGNLRTLFRRHLPQFFWTSIETGSTGRGIPDSHYLNPVGISGWIEFKQTHTWKVALRPEQTAWLERYSRSHGRAWVAVRRHPSPGPRRGPAIDELYLIRGDEADYLRKNSLREYISVNRWEGGPSKWDWEEIQFELTGVLGLPASSLKYSPESCTEPHGSTAKT